MTTGKQNSNPVRKALDAEAETLDSATLGKLRQARYRALEQEHRQPILEWLPAGNVLAATGAVSATVAVAFFAVWLGVISPQARVNTIEDLELLAAADNTELYEQMEFYEWLESQQQTSVDAS